MRSVGEKEDEKAEIWIDGSEDKQVVSIEDLATEIAAKQAKLIEEIEKVEISETAINLKVFLRNAPELSLYDLPGITYKSAGLTEKIRKMIRRFTMGSETLNLLILPANTDLTTSEALAICRENKDYRERIIPVITKIDLAVNEKGILNKIINNELDLKFQPVVVRNRTTEELSSQEERSSILQKELDLFKTTESLQQLPEACRGVDSLISHLITFQKDKLINNKSSYIKQISEKLKGVNVELSKCPLSSDSSADKANRFKECMNQFERLLYDLFNNIEPSSDHQNIKSMFDEKFDEFSEELNEASPSFLSEKYAKEISYFIKHSSGLRLPNFYESKIFEKIISKEIERIPKSIFDIVENLADIMKEKLLSCTASAFHNYPQLVNELKFEIQNSIEKQTENIQNNLHHYMTMQQDIIVTKDCYYLSMRDIIHSEILSYQSIPRQVPNSFANQFPTELVTLKSIFNNHQPKESKKIADDKYILINDLTIRKADIENSYFLTTCDEKKS